MICECHISARNAARVMRESPVIERCALHDAAPRMYDALKAAKRELDAENRCLFCATAEHCIDCPTPLIEAALSQVQGETA